MSAPRAAWWIVCDDHATSPIGYYAVGPIGSREAAERRLAEIEKLGACQGNHRIEQR